MTRLARHESGRVGRKYPGFEIRIRPGGFFVLSEAFSIGERFALSEQIRR
jgi:hypothetical protein